jgi:hypothetical protein
MRRGFIYVIGLAVIAFIVAGVAEFSVRSSTCMACHRQEAEFAKWMSAKLRDQNKGFSHELIGCADCHISGSPARTVMSRLRGLLHLTSYIVPQIDPRQPQTFGLFNRTRVPTENCQYCHYASVYQKSVYVKDLPAGLSQIGLTMDHRKHVLARDDTCAKCHERFKGPEDTVADKAVNYSEVNHLACYSCHSFASHYYRSGHLLPMPEQSYGKARNEAWERLTTNPRWMVAFPAEAMCRRCHNGKIHYKTRIFESDCRTGNNFENCLKCHPLMTKDYFENYLKERRISTWGSAANIRHSWGIDGNGTESNGRLFSEGSGGVNDGEPVQAWLR